MRAGWGGGWRGEHLGDHAYSASVGTDFEDDCVMDNKLFWMS